MRGFLLLVATGTAMAQIQPAAIDALNRSVAALQDLRSAEIETESTATYQATSRPLTIKASVLWSAPDKVRLSIGSATAGATTVTDGHTRWEYTVLTHEYVTRKAALPISAAQRRAFASLLIFSVNPDITSAKIAREEKLTLAGDEFTCSVLEITVRRDRPAESLNFYTIWIDRGTGLILKQEIKTRQEKNGKPVESMSSMVVRRLVIAPSTDSAAFSFPAPADANRVDEPRYSEGSSLKGKAMPDLEFTNLDGTPFDVQRLHGKAVLMTFGTTTCAPWRDELAQLTRILPNIRREDTGIILVDLNESPNAAIKWRSSNPADFPLMVARTGSFGQCPLNVFIDKLGTVTSVRAGVLQDSEMVAQLKNAASR